MGSPTQKLMDMKLVGKIKKIRNKMADIPIYGRLYRENYKNTQKGG